MFLFCAGNVGHDQRKLYRITSMETDQVEKINWPVLTTSLQVTCQGGETEFPENTSYSYHPRTVLAKILPAFILINLINNIS